MDPTATVSEWVDAVISGDTARARELSRAYRDWTRSEGYLAPCRVWSARVFGIPVSGEIMAIGDKLATVHVSHMGRDRTGAVLVRWTDKVHASRIIDVGDVR